LINYQQKGSPRDLMTTSILIKKIYNNFSTYQPTLIIQQIIKNPLAKNQINLNPVIVWVVCNKLMGVGMMDTMKDINKNMIMAITDVILIGIHVKVAVLVQMRLPRFKQQPIRFTILLFLPILQLTKFLKF
jgi:hypothetical protein